MFLSASFLRSLSAPANGRRYHPQVPRGGRPVRAQAGPVRGSDGEDTREARQWVDGD